MPVVHIERGILFDRAFSFNLHIGYLGWRLTRILPINIANIINRNSSLKRRFPLLLMLTLYLSPIAWRVVRILSGQWWNLVLAFFNFFIKVDALSCCILLFQEIWFDRFV